MAVLAHLELQASEVDLFAQQLGEILAYADQIRAIDTDGVAPTAHLATPQTVDRPDAVRRSLDVPEALAGAPEAALPAGLFTVPRVIG